MYGAARTGLVATQNRQHLEALQGLYNGVRQDFWAEGEESWRRLEPGDALPIAYITTHGRQSVESRLAEHGFTSAFPWGLFVPGLLVTVGGAVALVLSRKR